MTRSKPRSDLEYAEQCCLNVWALADYLGAPTCIPYTDAFNYQADWKQPDRTLIVATGAWLDWLSKNTDPDWTLPAPFRPWNAGIHKHDPLKLKPFKIRTARYGWRGTEAKWAAQIILHVPPVYTMPPATGCEVRLLEERFLEFDFDHWNPAAGAYPALRHGIETADLSLPRLFGRPKKRIDSFVVAEKLRERGINVPNV